MSESELRLTGGFVPRPRSRVHGPRRVLQELRRISIKLGRALEHRELTPEEQRWGGRAYDAVMALIKEGDQVLPGHTDPRPARKARKRKDK